MHSFLNGISLVFFETVANTMFLVNYDTSKLPFVYILSAFVSVVIGYFYTRLENRQSTQKLLQTTLAFVFSIVLIFFIFMKFSDFKETSIAIMVFKDVLWMFAGVEFGMLIGVMFNIRQSKRLLGILMSGEILAGILGGFGIGVILNMISTVDLLLISTIALFSSFVLLKNIINKYNDKFSYNSDEDEDESDGGYKELFQNKYYKLFFLISVLSFFIFYFIDFIFYYEVEKKYTDEKELATFFGIFYATLNIVNLVSSLFISGYVLARFGILFGLAFIPLLAMIGVSSLGATIMLSLSFAFGIVVVLKILDEMADVSILTPTYRVLYQAIPQNLKTKVLAFRETIIEPLAMGLAGVSLIIIDSYFGINIIYIGIVVCAILWLKYVKALKQEYVNALEKLINDRVSFDEDSLLDGVDKSLIIKKLDSENEIEVIYYLGILKRIDNDEYKKLIINFLNHKSLRVVEYTIEELFELETLDINIIKNTIDKQTDTKLKDRLIELYCKIGKESVIENIVQNYLKIDDIYSRGAIIGILDYFDEKQVAIKAIEDMIKNNDILKAIDIISNKKLEYFYDYFDIWIQSDNFSQKSNTFVAVSTLKLEKYIPTILAFVNNNEYYNIAIHSIVNYKNLSLGILKDELFKTNIDTYISTLIKIIASIKTQESYELLLELLNNHQFRNKALDRLSEFNYKLEDINTIHKILKDIIIDYRLYLDSSTHIDKNIYPNTSLILEELKKKSVDNIFLLLSLTYPRDTILLSMVNYNSNYEEKQAFALELIDNILSNEIKKEIIPVLDNKIIADINFKENNFIEKILKNDFPLILKISLLYEIAKAKKIEFINTIENINSINIKIKETKEFAIDILQSVGTLPKRTQC